MVKIEEFKIANNDFNLHKEKIKLKITKELQQLGKELIILNSFLNEIINLTNLRIFQLKIHYPQLLSNKDIKPLLNNNNVILLELANKVQEKKNMVELKLNMIIRNILISKNLKEIFKIRGSISNKEVNLLIQDIKQGLELLSFYKDEDISNFILAYMRKYIQN